MKEHRLRVPARGQSLPRERELAWRLAEVATDPCPVDRQVAETVSNRLVDAVAVAVAALDRPPVASARAQALAHPRTGGAHVIGTARATACEAGWASWANNVAVRDLDFNDSFFGRDTAHPSDNIPPVLAVAQQRALSGAALVRGIAIAYEVQIALAKSVPLVPHGIDQSTHLAPAMAAGVGAALGLPVETLYHAIGQAAHCGLTTRQGRRGAITSWKACVPAFAGRVAMEAVDRAMRGEPAPGAVYEGPEGLVAVALGGPQAEYRVPLPEPGEGARAVLETYPKAHAAGYASQAFIDLALRVRDELPDLESVDAIEVHTCAHHHHAHGCGTGDPQRYDPDAPRETLDHSIMYTLAVTLEDGEFHHERSYARERRHRASTLRLWRKIQTVVDPEWDRAYEEAPDFLHKAQGGRLEVRLRDGSERRYSIRMPDAHPLGARPFGMAECVAKFRTLCAGRVPAPEQERFLDRAAALPRLAAGELGALGLEACPGVLAVESAPGLFSAP